MVSCTAPCFFSGAGSFLGGDSSCSLSQCRKVSASCVLYKIYFRDGVQYAMIHLRPERLFLVLNARRVAPLREFVHGPVPCRTPQFCRSFVPSITVAVWAFLGGSVFAGGVISTFKSRVDCFYL